MLIDRPNGLGEVSEHLLVFEIEVTVIVVNDPGEDWILRKIVVGSACKHIENVEIMNIRYVSIGPAIGHFGQLDLYHLLPLLSQVPKNSLPSSVVLEYKQHRIRVVVKPDLYPDVLE